MRFPVFFKYTDYQSFSSNFSFLIFNTTIMNYLPKSNTPDMKKTINFHGAQICYKIEGSGNPVALLHGFPMDMRVWKDFGAELAKNHTVVTIDFPGFGQSEMLPLQPDMWIVAEVLHAVFMAEGIQQIVLAGHSMGGYLALAYARKYMETVKGILLFHSQAGADDEKTKQFRNQAIENIVHNKDTFVKGFIDGLFHQPYLTEQPEAVEKILQISIEQKTEAIAAAMAGLRDRADQTDLLQQLTCPVFFIIGKNDSRIPAQLIMPQVEMPEHSELLLLANTGHMGFIEARDITLKATKSFIERCF